MERTIIRGGLVFDGTGAPGALADVLIEGERVSRVAPPGALAVDASAARSVDARGRWVTPGFLDTHTHYDGELALAPGLVESVRHGVTSVVIGCCSVSFVASAPDDCADMFTRVEAVPREVVLPLLRETKRWSDASGWRAWIDQHPLGPNVASFLGHSDIRCRAMGLARAVDRRARPTDDEQALMERLLSEALDCGFLGLSGMTNPWDKLDGEREWSKPLPSTFARARERRRLRALLRRRGYIHQTAPNLVTRYNVLGMVLAGAGLLRRPLKTTLITMMDLKADRYVYAMTSALEWIANTLLRGDFRWQSPPVPFDLYYDGMDSVLFEEFPAGQAVRDLARDLAARRALLTDPGYRARFRREMEKRFVPRVWHRDLGDAVILEAPDPALVGRTFTEVAAARGADPIETFLDLMIEHDRALRWHTCIANDRPEVLASILRHPGTLLGFADSGAHLRNMAFYNFPVRVLKRVRDAELAGAPIMSTARAVHRLTGELADWFGLDAGRLREGDRADVVVLDPARLDDAVERVEQREFPGMPGFCRLVNGGEAVREVFVAGTSLVRDGVPEQCLGQRRCGRFLERAAS
ncbi:MAG: N-acyl-D-glutamate amidohydrolase [Myxococcales bacterium]|nr:N-acyl-D-glutamate amidohydrolase [Myxococcales bacterium]MCB9753749.1 N-acyl-D-glutamate amidohydrolase [Myxococcales bacterium]